ncbi:hypothetical protein NQ314_019679 [Rhamnusium bicolor]|uniref:Uncharacterized protein n=1 Tax=Rhamnusium bicolor TaxID=1586634 RepID=A0AAV8WN65_9CUCU|nr:hypothetical protein NQ314_019679 [Rhamnusium bicolor]
MYMWHIIFIAAFPYIFGAATRPMEPLEGPLWGQRIAEALSSTEDLPSEIFKQRYPYEIAQTIDTDDSNELRPPNDKRALAMFARWGSINSIGKNRTPIRSKIFFDPEESISTQTRGRMLGQPLRWG